MSNQVEFLTGLVNVAIPEVYQKGMSYYEVLTAVVNKVNELIKQSNEYFSESVQTVMTNILVGWKNDGTLDDIIADAILDIGDRQYTEQNYVTNSESVTSSIDALDVGVATQLANIALNVEKYPRIALETSDDGRFIRALADLKPNQKLIGDTSKVYLVKQILINKSNVILEGLNLKLIDGDNKWCSPVKIAGTRETPTSNVRLINLTIDGNRTNQTNIPVNNPTENRPGIAIFGFVSDVLIENCVSNYNAGDGIWIYSRLPNNEMIGTDRLADDKHCFTNIKVKQCTFMYNRRHGGALDSVKGAVFEDCVFNYNGTNINGGLTDGDKGETYNNNLHANGFDLEGYGLGTAFNDITFLRCEFQFNASRAMSLYEGGSGLTYSPFVQRSNITFEKCKFQGNDTEGYSFYISPTSSNRTRNPRVFGDINIIECEFLTGKVLLQSVDYACLFNNMFGVVGGASITIDNSSNIKLLSQANINSSNVFRGANATDIRLMMENNNMTRPLITVGSYASLPTTATDGTIAFIQSPTTSSIYAYIRQSGAWRALAQQIGTSTVVGTAPSGALNKSIPLRNDDGSILGYIPIYS